jgi:hypothetical protein
MFKKNDPLVNAVQKVMAENAIRYQVEQKLCEELGIYSKNALPNEHKANFAALLDQRINEALHPNQQKLDVHEPEKDKLTAQDFKMLRSKKKMPQGADYAEKRRKARMDDNGRMDEEEQLDELKGIKSGFTKLGYLGKASKVIRKTDPKDIANDPDTERKFKNRMTGLKNLLKRTQKEEVEEGGETREGGAVTKDGKAVVSPTAMKAEPKEGPSASDRSALTNKIKSIMKEAKMSVKKEVELDEADSYSIRNTKTDTNRIYHISKYPITTNHKIYKKIKAKDPQAQIHKNGQPVKKEVEEIDEAAKSKSQQRLFGAALATRRGESEPGSRKIAKLAADVPESELKKFAGTKLKGLPEKKK